MAARVDELEALLQLRTTALADVHSWIDELLLLLLTLDAARTSDPVSELDARWPAFGKSWRVVDEQLVVLSDAIGDAVGKVDGAAHGCVAVGDAEATWLSGSGGCAWPNRHAARRHCESWAAAAPSMTHCLGSRCDE